MNSPEDQLRRIIKPPEELVQRLCQTVDGYTLENPTLSVIEVLAALERIRYVLTERMLGRSGD